MAETPFARNRVAAGSADVLDKSSPTRDVEMAPLRGPEAGTSGVTLQDLRQHVSAESCWICVGGMAYDVTGFLQEHPGGADRLLRVAGGDASRAFEAVGHSQAASELLAKMVIGPVVGAEAQVPRQRYDCTVEPPGTQTLLARALPVVAAVIVLLSTRNLVPPNGKFSRSLSAVLLGFAIAGFSAGTVLSQLLPRSAPAAKELGASTACLGGASLLALAAAVQLAPLSSVALGAAGALLLELRAARPVFSPLSCALLALLALPAGSHGNWACGWSSQSAGACGGAPLLALALPRTLSRGAVGMEG
ncbi:unnamed protein product, partial [Polarella glacialis]